MLLKTACLFHDAGFITSRVDHEKQRMCTGKKTPARFWIYSQDEIDRICGMIMATKIPQSPKNNLEEIICDADLDYLGRDDFFAIGDSLFEEVKISGSNSR